MKYLTLITVLLITFGTQAGADGKWNCNKFGGEFTQIHRIDDQACPTQCNVMNKIYDNCFVDKMKGTSKVAIQSVRRSCKRIACEPTFFQKLRYK